MPTDGFPRRKEKEGFTDDTRLIDTMYGIYDLNVHNGVRITSYYSVMTDLKTVVYTLIGVWFGQVLIGQVFNG